MTIPGHRTYEHNGYRVFATPWARPYMTDAVVRDMALALEYAGLTEATIAANGPEGPFFASIADDIHAQGRTPLVALDRAIAARREAGW